MSEKKLTREEMLSRIKAAMDKMTHEELVKFSVVVDRLSETVKATGEAPSLEEMRETYNNA